MEKLNVEIVQQVSLTNITIESTIRDQIIAAQKENKGIGHIKRKLERGKHLVLELMKQMSYGSRIVWSYQEFLVYVKRSSMKHT
jgi:hypothetical protein